MITSRENRAFLVAEAAAKRRVASRAFYNSVFVMPFVKTAAMTLVLADWVIIITYLLSKNLKKFC